MIIQLFSSSHFIYFKHSLASGGIEKSDGLRAAVERNEIRLAANEKIIARRAGLKE